MPLGPLQNPLYIAVFQTPYGLYEVSSIYLARLLGERNEPKIEVNDLNV